MSDALDHPVRTLISPGRYAQGRGAIDRLGPLVEPIGRTPWWSPTTPSGPSSARR